MPQNNGSMVVTQEQQDAALAGVAHAEAALVGLISLEPAERRSLHAMGPKSDAFARGTLRVLQGNPQIVPPALNVAGAVADLAALDRLLPILDAMQRLLARVDDTVAALGSDIMDVALDGYGQLRFSGDAQGVESLRKDLGARFAKAKRRATDGG